MIVETTRFGDVDVADDAVLHFDSGLLGLEDEARRLVLLERDGGPYHWLQSATHGEIAMLVVDPWEFFPDYEIDVPDDVQNDLGLTSVDDTQVMVIVSVVPRGEELDVTANLLGPLVVNSANRQGRQLVLEDTEYTTRERVV